MLLEVTDSKFPKYFTKLMSILKERLHKEELTVEAGCSNNKLHQFNKPYNSRGRINKINLSLSPFEFSFKVHNKTNLHLQLTNAITWKIMNILM